MGQETRVVNLNKEPFDVYIGRRGRGYDGYFGNPFPINGWTTRQQSIDKFRSYFSRRLALDEEFNERVNALKGKVLGCFCKPLSCHGDVIKEWLDALP